MIPKRNETKLPEGGTKITKRRRPGHGRMKHFITMKTSNGKLVKIPRDKAASSITAGCIPVKRSELRKSK